MKRVVNELDKLSGGKMAYAVLALCTAVATASPAQTFTTLANFLGDNGANPRFMSLVQGTDGNLYGTTCDLGCVGETGNGFGTVLRVTFAGTLTTLYNFCAQPKCTDGAIPYGGLLLGTDGNFYGTTAYGGANDDGTVFSITLGGELTTLHSFDSTDGANPYGTLIQASDGNFYGTTVNGGAYSYGTVFEITSGGTLTTLHSFTKTDGAFPEAGLVQGTNGKFYGTTYEGGANGYEGTVFSITAGGRLTTLHSFDLTDGYLPAGTLVQATNGNFYGTTVEGGAVGSSYGTVFKITPGGKFTMLHSFDSAHGALPEAGLVQATNGMFYGTTIYGGANGSFEGTVFRITAKGTVTTLHSFDTTDGNDPYGGLVQATNGVLYGTTNTGGTSNDGTVFSLAVGLHAFVKTVPASGNVGAAVIILGTNLTGATSVSFNGTAAAFTVNSSGAAISTTVPAGAATGTVQVTLSDGKLLSSNVPFRVP
jgi:uncharacterized repeat protein (TIGR03803 family)